MSLNRRLAERRQLPNSGPKRLKSSDLSTAHCKAAPEVALRITPAVPGHDAQLTLATLSVSLAGFGGGNSWIIDWHDAERYTITHSDLFSSSPHSRVWSRTRPRWSLDDGWSRNNQKNSTTGYLATV
jgi:hypothetical protein